MVRNWADACWSLNVFDSLSLSLDGSTCLHQAAYSGSIEMVALLLSIGADGLKRVHNTAILFK